MATRLSASEQFAIATDAALRGAVDELSLADFEAETAVVRRLRRDAAAGIPDPLFVDGLRTELLALAAGPAIAAAVTYATIETPAGTLAVAHRAGKVVRCEFTDPANLSGFERAVARTLGIVPQREPSLPPRLERAIGNYVAGRGRFGEFDISWLPEFQRRVLEKTAEIPRGEVRPYGWIAREIGSPGATRAVGTALGRNPIPLLVPCHRVVRSDGSLGEYSGGGPAVKVRVLEMEGVPVQDLLHTARSGERLRGCRTTHIVCYPSCHAARRVRPENAVPFPSLARAAAAGYRPCQLCRPA